MDESARDTEHAARLLRYLRDLARARRRPSRDLTGHDHVHWLSELPGDVYVETDAGPGDVLFSVPVIPLTPPVVIDEFDGWLALRNWYRILRDLAGQDVVLATGLLAWRPAVHDHLLNTPVRVVVDERTERVDVVLAGRTGLRDRELLAGHPGYRPAAGAADAVRAGQGFGLNASVGDVLRKWCSVALDTPAEYRDDWAPDGAAPAPVPRLSLAPALVVRPPGRRAVADYHGTLLRHLPGGVPDGLARLVSPSRKAHVMHVPEREPDTVPDLLAGLLARGHRVLVATSGATAAGALRAALPPGLADLAVADPSIAGQAADAILARTDAPGLDALTAREEAAARHVAELTERLGDDGAEEPGDPRERLRAEAPDLAWMPVRPGMPPEPPISRAEAAELVVLLAEETAERKARTGQRDVDPGALPSAAYVRTLIEAEATAAERAERSKTDLSRRLREVDVTLLARLDGDASVVAAALRDLGLDGDPGGWNPADLAAQAFGDALADRRPLIWARVNEMTARAQWAEGALTEIADHRIELPDDADLRGLDASAQDLRAYLAGGGALKRGPLRSSAQRQAEPLLTTVTVDGAAPTTPELLDILHTDLMVRITCRELQYVWEAAGISFPADLPPTERVARFVRAHARLSRIREAMAAVQETRELLARSGLTIPLGHPHQWHGYVTALRNALEGLGVSRAAADLDALRDSIGAVGDDDPPELQAALDAVDARDAAAYGRALGALAEARHERSRQLRCEELLTRLRAGHPDLANLMIATDGDEVWEERTPRWDEAWTAAHNATRETVPAAERVRADLAEAEERLKAARADLTAAHAWTAALNAVPASPTAPSDVVPAWILPLWRIPETLPPAPNSFDVVIVDGEHGAGAEALFLLWLAPRIILVGPPGDDLPPLEGPPPSTLLPHHLQGITPTTPLFTALTKEPPARPSDARPSGARPSDTTPDPGLPASPPQRPGSGAPKSPPPATAGPPRHPTDQAPTSDARRAQRPPDRAPTSDARPPAAPRENNPAPREDTPALREGTPAPREGDRGPAGRTPASTARPSDAPRPAGAPREGARPPAADASSQPPGDWAPVSDVRPPGATREEMQRPATAASPQRPADRTPVSDAREGAQRPEAGRAAVPQRLDARVNPPEPPEAAAPPRGGAGEGSGDPRARGAREVPPQRLDARGREPGRPARPESGGTLPPRRLDAPRRNAPPSEREPEAPPRRLDAPGRARRAGHGEPPPGATRPEIPAIWGRPGGRPEPPREPAAEPREPAAEQRQPAAEPTQVRRGRSIAAYKRPELVEIVGRAAARDPDLSDDQLVEVVTRLLGCPEDEALLVGARLRYAVEVYRKRAGRGDHER
ncbi:hypothetical protein ACN3XK_11250 [Actinomadura welshii]